MKTVSKLILASAVASMFVAGAAVAWPRTAQQAYDDLVRNWGG